MRLVIGDWQISTLSSLSVDCQLMTLRSISGQTCIGNIELFHKGYVVMMEKWFVVFGSGLMFLGVAAGAFGAHGLRPYFAQYPELAATYETAVRYHVYHALALFVAAWLAGKWPGNLPHWAGYCFLAGTFLFSGSLYLLVFTRLRWLGAVTPLGGVAFLAGWFCLCLAAWRS